MGNIDNRYFQLRGDIEELRILVDESESKLMMFIDLSKMIGDKNSDKLNMFTQKNVDLYLDLIRNHITIIRKISPKLADDLETRANRFDRIMPKFLEIIKELEEDIRLLKESISTSESLIKLTHEEIELTKKGIRNKDRYNEIEYLLKKKNEEKVTMDKKLDEDKQKHQNIETELNVSLLTLHDNVMMTSKAIIDTLDFLNAEKLN